MEDLTLLWNVIVDQGFDLLLSIITYLVYSASI